MKKNLLAVCAVTMALVFSAFKTIDSQQQNLWYKDGNNFIPFTDTPCPADNQVQCQALVEGVGIRPLYTAPNDFSPYMTRH